MVKREGQRDGMLPASGAQRHVTRAQPGTRPPLPACLGSAILPLLERREWVILTHPVYRVSPSVADAGLPTRAFLVRLPRPTHEPAP